MLRLALSCFILVTAAVDAAPPDTTERLLAAAGAQIGVTTSYDGAYRRIDYPMGDPPRETGVCTDVVIRAYRDAFGIDLQRLVHEDMRAHFASYPKDWGLRGPDRNIDHRRVPNLRRFLTRQGAALTPSSEAADYQPGDIVTWDLGRGLTHIGFVDEGFADEGAGRRFIIHNIGAGTQREDVLFSWTITGHYRWLPADAGAPAPGSPRSPARRDAGGRH